MINRLPEGLDTHCHERGSTPCLLKVSAKPAAAQSEPKAGNEVESEPHYPTAEWEEAKRKLQSPEEQQNAANLLAKIDGLENAVDKILQNLRDLKQEDCQRETALHHNSNFACCDTGDSPSYFTSGFVNH